MKEVIVTLAIIVAAVVVLAMYCCLAVASKRHMAGKELEQATAPGEPVHHCDSCLRWDECNGTDKENCPLWRGQNNEEEKTP